MTDIPEGIQLTPFHPEFERDPYAVYARLREASSVHFDGYSYTVSGYEEVEALLKDDRLSVDPRKVGQARDPRADNAVTRRAPDLMSLDAPDHTRLRRLVNKAFTPSSVSAFRPKIESIAEALVRGLPRQFDVIASYAGPLSTSTIAEFLGIDADQAPAFKQWTNTLLLQGYPMPSEDQWRQIVDADQSMRACVRDIVKARHNQQRDDLISSLVESEATEDEAVDMCTLLVGAGNFTTTDLIGNAILRLAEDDRARLSEFVEETLRLDPPSQSVRRWALADVNIGDKTIRAGSQVLLLIGSANHDPKAGPHLSFGRGVHHCLGATLARLTTEIALSALPPYAVRSFKRRKSLTFRGCSELVIELK